MIQTVKYQNLPNCLEISNGDAELIISTDVGPRILFYGFDGGENILGWHPEAEVNTALGKWKPYGGHRLWRAPENMPLSYAPDSEPVEFTKEGDLSVHLMPPLESATHLQKEMTVTLAANGTEVTIDHTITNHSDAETEISAWALTIMRPGGEVIIPNEPFKPYSPETLLPIRSMALWSYTDFTDPRWRFEKDAIRLRVDENINTQQKIGLQNRQGWAGYRWGNRLFVKKFDFIEDAVYLDMNSNMEVYTDGGFVEIETLSPLKRLRPEEAVTHQERWELSEG
jgi:hypothetical protein